jgi:hypothetical protein
MKHFRTATLCGDAEVNHAIATLVLAFDVDLVARWMYEAPDQYLQHIPRLFRALAARSFEANAAHRSLDGAAVAIWVPAGVHGDIERSRRYAKRCQRGMPAGSAIECPSLVKR